MIEYILVVIIAVTMLFLAKSVFSNMNKYISGYVGGYFKCLMVQGELPALGVSDGDLSKHTGAGYKCSASLDKTPIASQDGGGTKNIGTTTPLSSEVPKGSTKATASSRAGVSSPSSSSKKSATKRPNNNNNNSSDDGDDSTKFSSNLRNRSDAYSSSDSEGDDNVRSVPMARRDLDADKSQAYRPVTGKMEESIKKNTRGGGLERRQNVTQKISLPEDDIRPGPRRSMFSPPQRSVATMTEEPEMEMGFGYFMKWIMIAGIGIAIFIFFGGQIMNYNNSDS